MGISAHAATTLGDIVHIEMPESGSQWGQGEVCCDIESVKTAASVYMPVSGTLIEINAKLTDEAEILTGETSENEAWLMKVNVTRGDELASLMTEAQYAKFLEDSDDH